MMKQLCKQDSMQSIIKITYLLQVEVSELRRKVSN